MVGDSSVIPSYSLSVAPMMARTTRHCRVFHRIVAPQALLYTEMIAANALRFGDARRLLEFSDVEHPVALQLGGDDASTLGWCSGLAEDAGYDEVNLNVGCPSPRVQKGSFGACLMKRPQDVAEIVKTMRVSATIPITVKCRIGVDEFGDYKFLESFTKSLCDAGVERVIVHARMAFLKGLSPKENRTVPPLRYDRVQRLVSDFPTMTIIVNGGINSLQAARDIRSWSDGIMIGRAALEHPALLAAIHDETFGSQSAFDPIGVLGDYLPYVEAELSRGTRLPLLIRHLFSLFNGMPGARNFRRYLSKNAYREDAGVDTLQSAIRCVA